MTFFRVEVSAIREGPVTLSVAARERLISVTVALFEGSQSLAETKKLGTKSAAYVERSEANSFSQQCINASE